MKRKPNIAIGVLVAVVVMIAGFWMLMNLNRNPGATTTVETETKVTTPVELTKMKPSDITFDESKINIYLFWGDGCPHCKDMAGFLGSIKDEYGKYYNLYTLEVWYDEENATLMDEVGKAIGGDPSGVPYLVIGDKSFTGYAPRMNEEITAAITEQYNRTDRVDAYKRVRE